MDTRVAQLETLRLFVQRMIQLLSIPDTEVESVASEHSRCPTRFTPEE